MRTRVAPLHSSEMEIALPVAVGLVLLLVLILFLARTLKEAAFIPPPPRSEADVLRDVGVRGLGKVIFMQPTGNVVGDSREWHVTIEVLPEVGRPYRVNLVSVVAAQVEARVRIGHQVPIRINPKRNTDVVIDLV